MRKRPIARPMNGAAVAGGRVVVAGGALRPRSSVGSGNVSAGVGRRAGGVPRDADLRECFSGVKARFLRFAIQIGGENYLTAGADQHLAVLPVVLRLVASGTIDP